MSVYYNGIPAGSGASDDRGVVDAMAGAGWAATTAGGATAAWAGGKLTLSVPANAVGGVAVERASGLVPADAAEWDLILRLKVAAGDASNQTRFQIVSGLDTNNCVIGSMWSDGTIELAKIIDGSFTSLGFGAVGIDSGMRTGGSLWLRLAGRLHDVTMAFGMGVGGAVPKGWKVARYTDDNPALAAAGGGYCKLIANTLDISLGAGFTVEVSAIRARGNPPL